MPCFQGNINAPIKVVDEDKMRSLFEKKLPNSAYTKHGVGRRCINLLTRNTLMQNNYYELILNNASQSILMLELSTIIVNMKKCCTRTYKETIECKYSAHTIYTKQNTPEWLEQRRYRVTGSTCYNIFTYSRCNWEYKAMNHFWPKHFTNKFVQHGVRYEKSAIDAFCRSSGLKVVQCGFIISNSNKWLGYSPDGVILKNNKPNALLEVKCLFKRSTTTIKEAIKSAEFVKRDENVFFLE